LSPTEGRWPASSPPADISSDFKANGTLRPQDDDYQTLLGGNFADYRLVIDGLVEQPLELSLADPRAAARAPRSPATTASRAGRRSASGRARAWAAAGPREAEARRPLHRLPLRRHAGADAGRHRQYYESIDLIDAYHPQTILAYEMNDAPLPVRHGAPLRLRVERQLGYKHAKYVMRIEAWRAGRKDANGEAILGRGKGGFWPDRGYEWYAGI
jgi:DMSO/TMAO reductase YedYZ molybdopterin-dependent catalytic subunit